MKKLVSLFLAVIFVFALSCSAYAEVYTFDEFNLSYDIPEEWLVVTKDTPEDAKVFADYLYYDETMQYMSEMGLCLYAISEDFNTEFFIELSKSEDYVELSDYSKTKLNKTLRQVKETWEGYGFENCVVDTYSNDITTFITISYDYSSSGVRVYGLDYIAYIDGNYTVFYLSSYYDEISESEIEAMRGIADSIVSTNIVPEDNNSGSSVSSRGILSLIRRVAIIAVAGISSFFAWIKKKSRKNKDIISETPSHPEENLPESADSTDFSAKDVPETISGEYHFENKENCCSSCGAPLSDEDKTCPVCGEKTK